MKTIVKRLLLLTLLVAMGTTMTGSTFGRARIGVEFIPDPLVINRDEEEIVGAVTLSLDGFGTFTLNEIRIEFVDDDGQTVESEHLPQGGALPNAIPLGGTLGMVKKTVTLKDVMGCFRHNRNTENGSENVTGEIED